MNKISILLILAFTLGACTTVNPGHTGVKIYMGDVKPEPLDSGFAVTGFAAVHEISLQAQSLTDTVEEDSQQAAQVTFGETLQALGYSVDMQWRVADGSAAIALYEGYNLRQRGEEQFAQVRLLPVLRESLKQVFNGYTLTQLIQERDQAAVLAEGRMQELIDQRLPPGAIVIDDIAITNFDYDEQLEASFRATIQARQNQELAEQERQRAQIQMQTEVDQAEASRRAQVERATGQAEADRIAAEAELYVRQQQAEGEAAFFQALSDAGVDPNTWLTMQTWDGTVPTVVGGGSDASSPVVLPLNLAAR